MLNTKQKLPKHDETKNKLVKQRQNYTNKNKNRNRNTSKSKIKNKNPNRKEHELIHEKKTCTQIYTKNKLLKQTNQTEIKLKTNTKTNKNTSMK